jgi:hypothetical protein
MELVYADEYIACINSGKKPFLAVAGPFVVTNGFVSNTGCYFLDMGGEIYEVKPDFPLSVQWEKESQAE